jgi:SlyX protein
MENIQYTEQRLIALEVKTSFADDMIDQLNQALFRQQKQIDKLTRELEDLKQRMPESGTTVFRSLRDELPPHY